MQQKAAVTIGFQVGGSLADEATEPHYLALAGLLRKHCVGPYSPDVDNFALVLRIDGDGWYWEQEGCDRLRRSKKDRYITIDMYLPRVRWEGVSGIEIRRYLTACTEEALSRMVARLQKDKVAVDGASLQKDFAVVKSHYLPQVAPTATPVGG